MAGEGEKQSWKPGWYRHGTNGLRFWDGERWTEHVAPAPRAGGVNGLHVAIAVFAGVIAAWLVILGLAQADPDTFYVPVKFVVDELPEF